MGPAGIAPPVALSIKDGISSVVQAVTVAFEVVVVNLRWYGGLRATGGVGKIEGLAEPGIKTYVVTNLIALTVGVQCGVIGPAGIAPPVALSNDRGSSIEAIAVAVEVVVADGNAVTGLNGRAIRR